MNLKKGKNCANYVGQNYLRKQKILGVNATQLPIPKNVFTFTWIIIRNLRQCTIGPTGRCSGLFGGGKACSGRMCLDYIIKKK